MAGHSTVEIKRQRDYLLLQIMGERIDYMIIDRIRRGIEGPAAMGFHLPVILDLSAVDFIPSLIMGALVDMLKKLKEKGQRFILTGLGKHVRESFAVTRIDILFEIFPTLEQAALALGKPAGQTSST